jgi:hypothetical protein
MIQRPVLTLLASAAHVFGIASSTSSSWSIGLYLLSSLFCLVRKPALRIEQESIDLTLNNADLAVDRYEAMPGQVPPHPMHVDDNKLIKASIDL